MAIQLSKLEKYFEVEKLVFHSHDQCLYLVSAFIDGEEHYIKNDSDNFLKAFNILELQKQCAKVNAKAMFLKQSSPYDEMIGGPNKIENNDLLVPLADNQLY